MRTPLRVGVVGVGHLGSRHAQTYATLPGVRLVAVCDTHRTRAQQLARRLRCEAVTDVARLLGRVDAVSVVVPTSMHYPIGRQLVTAGIHVLIEKPITTNVRQADLLILAAQRRGVVLQVGHIERFNAAFQTAAQYLTHPRFIEVHRLSPYPFRGTDVSVVLDLMIHDLDLILALVRSRTTQIDALGVPVVSPSEDIANTRLSFASGCVANLTASRISDETVRRIRVFQEDSYLSIDYQAQVVELARKRGRKIQRAVLPVNRRPPLERELAAFVRSIHTNMPPLVSGADGRAALALALRIEQAMRRPRTNRRAKALSR